MGAHLAKPARSAGRRKGDVAADEAVYGAIRRAMHMGRLSPGTKLQEPALARVLKVSRERVRKALHRLVHEGWLQAVPNRGTFVPRLTIGEMRQIYDVRTMLEAAIVRRHLARTRAGSASTAFEDATFDYVYSHGVLHHSDEPEKIVDFVAS